MDFLIESWNKSWDDFFNSRKSILKEIDKALKRRRDLGETIFPARENIFKAFEISHPQDISVVILGQDPYHGENEATGLAFSVPKHTKIPPSLRNIFRELSSDIGSTPPPHGDLTKWARQGVLLLNSILTVTKDQPASHSKIGWGHLTDGVISYLSAKGRQKIFVLWGNFAISKKGIVDHSCHQHPIVCSTHPSPLSANKGFLGSKPFSLINSHLAAMQNKPIDWSID